MGNIRDLKEVNDAALNPGASKRNSTGYRPGGDYDESYRGSKAERVPFRLSTMAGDISFYLWVNPSECNWRIPLRTTIESIQGGAVHHEWDSVGVGLQQAGKLDQAVINFTFQSGSISPRGHMDVSAFANPAAGIGTNQSFQTLYTPGESTPGGQQPSIPAGLGNFYDFLNLLNQPNIDQSTGNPNYVVIEYVSMIFPQMTLRGFFSQEGVQWNDSADNPLGVTGWGASFVVFQSSPALFDRGGLTNVYQQIFF